MGKLSVVSGTNGFGKSGPHTVVTMERPGKADGDLVFRGEMEAPTAGRQTSTQAAIAYERRVFAGSYRSAASYAAHPELAGAGVAGVQILRLANAKKMRLGDTVDVEAGGTVYMIRAGATGFTSQPFLRVTVHPGEAWAVRYSMTKSRDVQGFDDVSADQVELPIAGVVGGRVQAESGMHQEFSVSRKLGGGVLSGAVFHDAKNRSDDYRSWRCSLRRGCE